MAKQHGDITYPEHNQKCQRIWTELSGVENFDKLTDEEKLKAVQFVLDGTTEMEVMKYYIKRKPVLDEKINFWREVQQETGKGTKEIIHMIGESELGERH